MTTLSAGQVEQLTGQTVTEADVALAAELIDDQTGYTPGEHVSDRGLAVVSVQAAWALVSVRVHRLLNDDETAVTSETQGDYSYSEDADLSKVYRFSNVTDGRPRELLNMARARWGHI